MEIVKLPDATLPEGTVHPETVLLKREQLDAMIQALNDYKVKVYHFENDITQVAQVIGKILPLFEGKTSVFAMAPAIMQLINDKETIQDFQNLMPILNKYQIKNNG